MDPPDAGSQAIRSAAREALLRSHATTSVLANLASAAVAVLAVATLGNAVARPALMVWFALLLATIAARLGVLVAHRRAGEPDGARWLAAYRLGALLHGTAWGTLALLLRPGAGPDEFGLLTLLLGGLAAGAMMLVLFDAVAALLFTLPVLAPLAWRLALSPQPVPDFVTIVGTLIAMLGVFYAIAARRAARERLELATARHAEAERAAGARHAEAQLRLIFDHAGEGIAIFDGGGALVAANARFADVTGLPEALMRPGAPLADALRTLAPALAGTDGAAVVEVVRNDGGSIELRRSPTPGGGFVLLGVDTRARHDAEQRLQQAGEQLAHKSRVLEVTLDSLVQGVLSVDAAGRVTSWNRRLLELLDLPENFLRSAPTMAELIRWQVDHGHYGPDLRLLDEPARSNVMRYMRGEPVPRMTRHYRRTTLDGRVLDVRTHAAADGSVTRTYTDITAELRAQTALRESETRFRSLADAAPALIWLSDTEGRQTWFNQRWLEYRGTTMDEELAHDWTSRVHPDDYERCRVAFAAAFGARERYDIEFRLRRADGGWGWIADTGIPRAGPAGRFEGYVSYGWEISERKAAEAALIAAKDEAERANRAKSEFLSRMSHELRTPMNAILGFGQLLENDGDNPLTPTQRGRVRELLRGGRHLLTLINEVLDLARIESGALQLQLEPVDVPALVAACRRLVQPVAEQREITLDVDTPDGPCHALADRQRLQQVVLNLLSNAIKYNRRGGQVRITCRRDGERVRLEVSDCGPGISAQQQTRLFQAFERLDADKSAVEGAGIGLALSKWLVDLMKGEIGVTSEVGAGSTFWVDLVGAEAQPEPAPPDTAPMPLGEPPASRVPPTRTVLYIEDNPVNQILMQGMLARRPGIRLLMADRALAGLEIAAADPPDLVLLDIQLPGIDGFETLRRLRAAPATRDLPVIAVSANAMPGDVEQARRAGFSEYLTKPLEMKRLLDVVDRALEQLA
jgi:PAS domain S-box-containing protein